MYKRLEFVPALVIVCVMVASFVLFGSAHGMSPALYQNEWERPQSPYFLRWYRERFETFKNRFMARDGRVIDPENKSITHSEAMAYALLIAYVADDPKTFQRLLNFADGHLRRSDGLYSWKYVPGVGVVDPNNATDADLIIAASLSLAAKRWGRRDYQRQAIKMAESLGDQVLVRQKGRVLMLPGVRGFDRKAQTDGPVVNLSYYHIDFMRMMAELVPGHLWSDAVADGKHIIHEALRGDIVTNWVSARNPDVLAPSRHMRSNVEYGAVRMPMNFIGVERIDREALSLIDYDWNALNYGIPYVYDHETSLETRNLNDRGYRFLASMVQCAVHGTPIPPHMFDLDPTTYFSTAIHLIAIAQVYVALPQCVPTVS